MSPQNKNLFGVLLVATALFLFWVLDVAALNKIQIYREAISSRKIELRERQNILNKIESESVEAQQKVGDMQRFSSVVPSKKEVAELVSAIERMSLASGVQLQETGVQENSSSNLATADYKSMSVVIRLVGSYQGVLDFLNALEKNIRLLDVQTVELTPTAQNPNLLDVSIQATAYFLK